MHDWTLLSILFEWTTGRATLSFQNNRSETVSLVADAVADIQIPRLHEWGSSASVNKMIGPTLKGELQVIEIQMQSGDTIRLVASSFQLPLQT